MPIVSYQLLANADILWQKPNWEERHIRRKNEDIDADEMHIFIL